MKYIRVLPPIALRTMTGKPVVREGTQEEPYTVTQAEFIYGRMADSAFGTDMLAIQAQVAIMRAIERAEEKSDRYIVLDDAHHARLRHATEHPHPRSPAGDPMGYTGPVVYNMLPYMEAIVHATSEPEPETLSPDAVERAPHN